jgi:hypothetical protein
VWFFNDLQMAERLNLPQSQWRALSFGRGALGR